tara:strand:- start:613 stop:891 length:279 start_codon:yes stop_codon:yes gene_type:complete
MTEYKHKRVSARVTVDDDKAMRKFLLNSTKKDTIYLALLCNFMPYIFGIFCIASITLITIYIPLSVEEKYAQCLEITSDIEHCKSYVFNIKE